MHNKYIFIINGTGGSGKDTFVEFIDKNFPGKVENFSSVTKIKEIATIIGWNGQKTEKDRKFLSDLKALCGEYNNLPLRSMSEKVDDFLKSDKTVLFLHIREPEEIEIAKLLFNAKTILINRSNIPIIESNASDRDVNNYDYDYYIYNDGTLKDFEHSAIDFMNSLLFTII